MRGVKVHGKPHIRVRSLAVVAVVMRFRAVQAVLNLKA